MEYSREERAAIAHNFREDIKKYGIREAICSVIQSTSDKVPVRKTVLVQQCRKPNFRREFDQACDQIRVSTPSMRSSLVELRRDVLGEM